MFIFETAITLWIALSVEGKPHLRVSMASLCNIPCPAFSVIAELFLFYSNNFDFFLYKSMWKKSIIHPAAQPVSNNPLTGDVASSGPRSKFTEQPLFPGKGGGETMCQGTINQPPAGERRKRRKKIGKLKRKEEMDGREKEKGREKYNIVYNI